MFLPREDHLFVYSITQLPVVLCVCLRPHEMKYSKIVLKYIYLKIIYNLITFTLLICDTKDETQGFFPVWKNSPPLSYISTVYISMINDIGKYIELLHRWAFSFLILTKLGELTNTIFQKPAVIIVLYLWVLLCVRHQY